MELRRQTISPGGIRTRGGRAPIRGAIWTPITHLDRWTAVSILDASLWLTTQKHHKFGAIARLRAQCFVRDDQGRSRRDHLRDSVERVLGNGNPVERLLRVARADRRRIGVFTAAVEGSRVVWHAAIREAANQRYHAPSK